MVVREGAPGPNRKGDWLMKSLSELKDEVQKNLSKYAKIEAFFKDSLVERMKIDDGWIENPLILLLLDPAFFQESALHTLIESLSSDKGNFKILKSKLNPKDQYDEKIRDVLAELNGYYHLKKAGFERIEALREETGRKKPDFAAKLRDRLYLFEVKNMRAPIEVCDFLLVKSEARRQRFPDVYEAIGISFEPSPDWLEIELTDRDASLEKQICRWLEEMFATLESGKDQTSLCIEPFNSAGGALTIECTLKQARHLVACCGLKSEGIVNDHDYQQSILLPLSERSAESLLQLCHSFWSTTKTMSTLNTSCLIGRNP
ncbi:MAG: hypothetical protein WBC88_02750 [Candidatus Zixiibacteriota bacterium]